MPITEFIKWNLSADDPSLAAESKQIVQDQTAPRGAAPSGVICSGTILFAHAFPV